MPNHKARLAPGIALRFDAASRAILNVPDGIDRLMGDRALYERMLLRFHRDYRDGLQHLRVALDDGDLLHACHLAHALKGAAGMIGAEALLGHACALELALRAPDPGAGTPRAALDTLACSLTCVLDLVAGMIVAHAGAREAAPLCLSPEQAQLLERLVSLLRAREGAAVDVLANHGTLLLGMLGGARFDSLRAALEELDFEAALAALPW
ncbi:MAG: Hpt domain-containing protein [Pseudomonadota bacterium]